MGEPGVAMDPARVDRLDRGLFLEYLTVGWNIVEAVVAIVAGWTAGSVALLGFGLDSVVEGTSGVVLIWRLRGEKGGASAERVRRIEEKAQRYVGYTLVLLAAAVGFEAVRSLWTGRAPEASVVGIVLAVLSVGVMWWLAREKHSVADVLGSRAMEADAFQTDACFWLSVFLLVGVGANLAWGWWWADPVAALGMCGFILREAAELVVPEEG